MSDPTPIVMRCPRCRAHKRASEYKRHAGRDGGRDFSACLKCAATRQRWRVAETVYGIDRRTAQELYRQPCAICGRGPDEVTIVIDHSHDTGAVRGPLCSQHNSALGLFQDSADALLSALAYLTRAADYRTTA